ncbi:MAG: glycolate oxidase subunit GlcE [Gammaproteobacteria bacterium]|nr:glycolate oxidase subunit GlcE [Rhodocyclaceae bacterium]MBU3908350.1 glycolate oxidase subunit GlcE [Gammaproteobacteria bacterium]MBU3987859.1 glycolate oxidase subunit GlcE [Gammaproteobacteria bacterium]MBU4004060.1 glycolate oxidase subunit GlcE [Gammaproteobacteria bacterium]MBU4020307.1 glycolate oxidase subunit GlcE [Gammaproteobacteria bacterium]
MTDLTEQLRERILAASSAAPLCIRGGGSKDFYGCELRGELLETRAHTGVLAYEPTELVITARCGTPLAEIEAVLAEHGQCLAFEPPRFAENCTIGGAVAAGLSGPRRVSAGAVRDFVLGVKILDGAARELSFGGQVMKNVAGYDVSRVMAGSLGTLGLLLEISIKVLPRPVAEATLSFAMPQAVALDKLNQWAAQPLPIVASAWQDGMLSVRLAGARAAIAAAVQMLGGEKVEDGATAAFWDGLRDQHASFFAGMPLWRLSVPSVAPVIALPGETLMEWGGAERWLHSDAAPATIRAAAASVGGSATLFRADSTLKATVGAFAPLPLPLLNLQRRLKQIFDPHGIFNPGRMYAEL